MAWAREATEPSLVTRFYQAGLDQVAGCKLKNGTGAPAVLFYAVEQVLWLQRVDLGIEGEGGGGNPHYREDMGPPFVLETGDVFGAGIVTTYNAVTGGQTMYFVGLSLPGVLSEKVGTITKRYRANQK